MPEAAQERARPGAWVRDSPWLLAAVLLVAFAILNAAIQANFFTPFSLALNVTTVLPLMLIAVGQTYVVLGGSIDLSLGAIVSLVNVVAVEIITALGTGPGAIGAGLVAGLATGLACGMLNGLIVSLFRLPPIVTTFATGVIFGGLALIVLPQAGGSLPPAYYLVYAQGFLGLTLPIWLVVLLIGGVWLVGGTRFNRHLLAVGSNRQAAFQTGLPVRRIVFASHAAAGLLAAMAALCILGVAGAGDPLMGQAFTLGSVSAVVLGGTALAGGWGGPAGSILGACILVLINNIIFFANIDFVYQSVVQSAIILAALAAGVFASRRRR